MTDDERLEVAERLRRSWPSVADENPVNRALRFYLAVNSAIFDLRGCDEKDTIDMLDRLADLIDPGESGQNLDRNQDSVPKESPAVQKASEACEHWLDGECYALRTVRPVDREELLELADEMETLRRSLVDQGVTYVFEWRVRGYARRIREALGVTDHDA